VETAVLCRSCSWFGVYRADVTERLTGCPLCGNPVLSARDIDEDDWHLLGRSLLEDEINAAARSEGPGSTR
jgi:hypothetical protein